MPQNAHGAAKGGVLALTYQLVVEGGPHGIRVNAVSPAMTETPHTTPLLQDPDGPAASIAARAPLGAVLACHGLAYRHCPGGFFKIRSNRLIEQSLGLPAPQWLYGRCNCMSDSVGRVVAEVVEILPPFNPEPGQSGYPLAGRGSATA